MKKLIATILVLGALLTGNNLCAYGNVDQPIKKPAKNTQVSFDNVNSGAKLFIKDKEDRILFSEIIQSDGDYNRKFDFTTLPENDYFFEIDTKGFITIYPFTVDDDIVELHEDLKTVILKPLLVLEDSQVKLMRNIDKKQSLNVEIYYNGQELVYNETISKDGMIGRIYDFSSSISGDYLFIIDFDDRSVSQTLNISTLYWEYR